jgi:hypothetical protein
MEDFKRRGGKWRYRGAVGNIPGMVAPPVLSVGYKMTANIDLAGEATTAPIFAVGGQLGGYALYLRDGAPVLLLSNLSGETAEVASQRPLSAGSHMIGLTYTNTHGLDQHRVSISADGQTVAEQTVDIALPHSYGISETFGVGIDNGSPVLEGAETDAPFPGQIGEVIFDFTQGR